MQITESFLDQLSAPRVSSNGAASQVFYRDSSLTGFAVRVTSNGIKSFIVEKRIQGKVRRVTLGRYGELSVEQARQAAQRFLNENATGESPRASRKQTRDSKITLREAFEDYLQSRQELKPSTIHDYRRAIEDPFEHWLSKPLAAITEDMVQLRHAALGKRSKARANNTMRVLRAIFNHAITCYEDAGGKPIITINPVNRLNHLHAWHKVARRQSWIRPDQLPAWFAATRRLNNITTRHYFYFLLFTGLRRSTASRLQWTDVDFQARTLAARDTTNRQLQLLPLSDFLYELLKKQKAVKASPYVFPSDSNRGYLVEPRSAVKRVSELSGISFTLHDLRRSFVKIAEGTDIPAAVLHRLLQQNPSPGTSTTLSEPEIDLMREAMQQITDCIISNSRKNTGFSLADYLPEKPGEPEETEQATQMICRVKDDILEYEQ